MKRTTKAFWRGFWYGAFWPNLWLLLMLGIFLTIVALTTSCSLPSEEVPVNGSTDSEGEPFGPKRFPRPFKDDEGTGTGDGSGGGGRATDWWSPGTDGGTGTDEGDGTGWDPGGDWGTGTGGDESSSSTSTGAPPDPSGMAESTDTGDEPPTCQVPCRSYLECPGDNKVCRDGCCLPDCGGRTRCDDAQACIDIRWPVCDGWCCREAR